MSITANVALNTSSIEKINNPIHQATGLPNRTYTCSEFFTFERERLFSEQWTGLTQACVIPNPGDIWPINWMGIPLVIVRTQNNQVKVFHNVCSHRGNKLVWNTCNRQKTMTCPYHAWRYNLDGSINSARLMDDNFNKKKWSLHKCNIRVFEGLIFINLSEKPNSFDEFISPTRKFIEFHGLGDAKIAHRALYPTEGNWKLTLDNFHECYHCQPSHPEYCAVHDKDYILSYGAGSNTGPSSQKFNKTLDEWNRQTKNMGHIIGEYTETEFNDYSRSAERTPLKEGKYTETRSGKPSSKLMGKFKEYDRGYTSVGTSPFNSLLMCNDFATLFTFIPVSTLHTEVELMWLVHKDAEEGKDYNLQEMTWMWDVTTIADKQIIENNQKGVLSSKYVPGPLSKMEKGLEKFKSWYLKHLNIALS